MHLSQGFHRRCSNVIESLAVNFDSSKTQMSARNPNRLNRELNPKDNEISKRGSDMARVLSLPWLCCLTVHQAILYPISATPLERFPSQDSFTICTTPAWPWQEQFKGIGIQIRTAAQFRAQVQVFSQSLRDEDCEIKLKHRSPCDFNMTSKSVLSCFVCRLRRRWSLNSRWS